MSHIDHLDNSHTEDHAKHGDFFRSINIQFLVHELKGPLDVLETNLNMLDSSLGENNSSVELSKKTIKRATRNAAKLRQIIYCLLEVGCSETGQVNVQEFCIAEAIQEMLRDIFKNTRHGVIDIDEGVDDSAVFFKQQRVELKIADNIKSLVMSQDKVKFSFILGNLVRNALKHRHSSIQIQLNRDEDNLILDILDDGDGVTSEKQVDMFECYAKKDSDTSIKGKGHGLGLAASRIMARHLGGDILFVPQATGAHFTLKLPVRLE